MTRQETFHLVIAANRLPVDRGVGPDGAPVWHRSPGGLVTAMDSVMTNRDGAWVGWHGEAGEAPPPWVEAGMYLRPVPLDAQEVTDYYEGFANDTLWPLYHDVIVPATFSRPWWRSYVEVNRRFAEAIDEVSAPGATVWVHDYQLQLVPAMVRARRPDVRIGWFDHIPFPPVELFAQLPWRQDILRGLLGADFLGFQRDADAGNFRRACRQLLRATTRGEYVRRPAGSPAPGEPVGVDAPGASTDHWARAAAVPISIDTAALEELARSPRVRRRAAEIRASVGNPRCLLLGVDRLDYTKGIRHRLKAYEELLDDGAIAPPDVVLVQIATPSRERVEAYRVLREAVESTVGRINGMYSQVGAPAVHYLHHTYPREEMAAYYCAADVLLCTPLRDGMNLVAKEYAACRFDDDGALVLSEFTGAATELTAAYRCNPHDIEGLKETMMTAIDARPADRRRRMRALRRIVSRHDVQAWARTYLGALETAAPPAPRTRP